MDGWVYKQALDPQSVSGRAVCLGCWSHYSSMKRCPDDMLCGDKVLCLVQVQSLLMDWSNRTSGTREARANATLLKHSWRARN